MEASWMQNSNVDKEDDDVSVIAVIGKDNDRSSMHRPVDKSSVTRDRVQGSRQVIELTDERCKMALRNHLDLELLSNEAEETTSDYKNMDILQKLPPETIVIKQERKYKDDSDYVRDSTETSSGGSTSGGVAKVRRVYRTTRKSRGTVEIRRNPIRVTKKDPDKDFPRPRQQLLSAKKREMLLRLEPGKRGKSSTMPYMNTRSVTRKMYNVGATYQAPSVKDEMEWKEWPVHGMHERPVFHPQVGLAAEYLGRYFTSIDGLSYHEIVDRPEIEVVSVDPRCDFLSYTEKKRNNKGKSNRGTANAKNAKTSHAGLSRKHKSFETCMHESFHCVLGYCSQVVTPIYKTNVEGKIIKLKSNKNVSSSAKATEKQILTTSVVDYGAKNESSVGFKNNSQKSVEGRKQLDNYTVTMVSQNVKNYNHVTNTRLFPARKVYVANPQKSIAFNNLKTLQSGRVKINEIVRPSSNPSETKDGQIVKSIPNNLKTINLGDPSISEKSSTGVSSMYKNVVPVDEQTENAKVMSLKVSMKRENKTEFTVTKYLLDNGQQNKIKIAKEADRATKKSRNELPNKELTVKTIPGSLSKTWCSTDTSQIAKILSEYNKSSTKKPAIENQGFYSTVKSIRAKEVANKEENAKQNAQENSSNRNMNIKFPQGRWRRFHLTVEKLKDIKGNSSVKNLSSEVKNRQSFKIDQTPGDVPSDNTTEVPKCLETFQRIRPNATNPKKKEYTLVSSSTGAATTKTQSLQELLENTAILYCAATGTHQDDLANYVDSLDVAQTIQWLNACKGFTV
ncbi:uncharacterized protein LOC143346223 [Colletes latitarsis]|uniref:uncharacterized protein LOC143346223 n=1 Tax=Colletes latitarsis TaxID=2605962 RepID=UPI0040368F41